MMRLSQGISVGAGTSEIVFAIRRRTVSGSLSIYGDECERRI